MFGRVAYCSACLSVLVACRAFTINGFAFGQTPQSPAGTAPEQTAAGAAGAPTFRIAAREVLLDVLVIDKNGQPVTGLLPSDFRVTEEGEAQTIRRVNEHRAMDAAAMSKLNSAPALPPNTFSNYAPVRNTNAATVLLLDAMDSPPGAQMAMREQLIKFLKHMQPGPPVAIFQLDTEMRLVQGFTSDPKVLLAAAESKRDMPSLARPTAAAPGFQADSLYRRTLMETLRNGMQMLGRYLAGYPGRKDLIWFTGRVPMTTTGMGFGYPFHDSVAVTGGEDETQELTDVLAVSSIAVYPVDTRGLAVIPSAYGSGRAGGGMMNPRGGMVNGPGRGMAMRSGFDNHANMDQIAQQTGGKAYYNTNDFTRVIDDVINTASNYYTIAYATNNTKWNGEFRRIKIAVERPDVQVQHKEGYYAYSLDKREQSGFEAIEQRKAEEAAEAEIPDTGNSQPPAGAPNPGSPANNPALGVTIQHSPIGGFSTAMGLGAISPTEIVFAARIQADENTEKLARNATVPQNNFLKPEWQHKPFRNFVISYDADLHKVGFTRMPDGKRHASIEFVAVVYSGDGEAVNSITETATFDATPERYRELLVSGLQMKEEIAVPVKGNFFLRLGVHDKVRDQMGALEIPVDQIKLGVAAPSAQAQ